MTAAESVAEGLLFRPFKDLQIPQRKSDGWLDVSVVLNRHSRDLMTFRNCFYGNKVVSVLPKRLLRDDDSAYVLSLGGKTYTFVEPRVALQVYLWLDPELYLEAFDWILNLQKEHPDVRLANLPQIGWDEQRRASHLEGIGVTEAIQQALQPLLTRLSALEAEMISLRGSVGAK